MTIALKKWLQLPFQTMIWPIITISYTMNDITYTTTEFQDLIEVDDVFDGIPPVNKRFLKA